MFEIYTGTAFHVELQIVLDDFSLRIDTTKITRV